MAVQLDWAGNARSGERAAPGRSDALLIAIGAVGFLAGMGAVWAASYGPNRQLLLPGEPVELLVGWSFIGSGLASVRARPQQRLGPVMIATGFVYFVGLLQQATTSALFTLGEAFQLLYLAGLLYVVLAFPSGQLWTALDRALCAVTLFAVTVVQVAMLLFAHSRTFICTGCPANLLELTNNRPVAYGLLQFQRTVGLAIMVSTACLLAVRLARASHAQRRVMAPVLLAGIVAALTLLASVAADIVNAPSDATLSRIAGYALTAVPLSVLIAYAQRRLARGAIAGLVVELGTPQSAVDLREALSRALGDPSLTLGYWFAAESRFVDRDGNPIERPDPASGRLQTVVERDGHPIAMLTCDAALEHNEALIDSVCAAAGLTLENERLQAELRARLAELTASRTRLIEATDAERRRIERDLHDGTQQRLVSIALSLGLLESRLPADSDETRPLVRQTRADLTAALAELRDLTQGIHPAILSERGLPAALDELARRAPLPTTVQAEIDLRLPDQVESAAYFMVSEGLANAAKHSAAKQVLITASWRPGQLTVQVDDDGVGGARKEGGTGLPGLVDRIEALGGTLTLSSPPGEGTSLRAELPCE
ncbi:MAG TPA: histidine kinase [Streptosporangiaceae bacterium]|nr:histidine kinase [Streptosporangiaceae bacterium]